ncbi:MAG: hypothetical protein Q9169_006990 [Polycauliona sp. 2 TL-2023]
MKPVKGRFHPYQVGRQITVQDTLPSNTPYVGPLLDHTKSTAHLPGEMQHESFTQHATAGMKYRLCPRIIHVHSLARISVLHIRRNPQVTKSKQSNRPREIMIAPSPRTIASNDGPTRRKKTRVGPSLQSALLFQNKGPKAKSRRPTFFALSA